MKRIPSKPAAALPVACLLAVALGACEAKKSSNPLSPSVAGPIAGVDISAPRLLEPAQGFRFKDSQQPIKLLIENATSTGVRPLTYTFEVATDAEFATKVFARANVPPGDGGRTSVLVDPLGVGRGYYWRVHAEDGANAGTYSTAQFEVLPKPVLAAPTPVSPINNERVTSRRPVLTANNSDRNIAIGALNYEFQVATDQAFGAVVASGWSNEGGGQTAFTVPSDLATDKQHFWRVRSTDTDTISAWSVTQTFRTPLGSSGPVPPPPGTGGSCASKDGDFIVRCLGAKFPDKMAAGVSLSQRIANMEFLRDRAIEAGICGGLDLAWNLKRGTGPRSTDALAWRHDGIVDVIDIGTAYDDTSRPLQLQWVVVAGPPGYDPYPRPNCSGI